jgi:hypothetical protein
MVVPDTTLLQGFWNNIPPGDKENSASPAQISPIPINHNSGSKPLAHVVGCDTGTFDQDFCAATWSSK